MLSHLNSNRARIFPCRLRVNNEATVSFRPRWPCYVLVTPWSRSDKNAIQLSSTPRLHSLFRLIVVSPGQQVVLLTHNRIMSSSTSMQLFLLRFLLARSRVLLDLVAAEPSVRLRRRWQKYAFDIVGSGTHSTSLAEVRLRRRWQRYAFDVVGKGTPSTSLEEVRLRRRWQQYAFDDVGQGAPSASSAMRIQLLSDCRLHLLIVVSSIFASASNASQTKVLHDVDDERLGPPIPEERGIA
jgi:hypothetical protein